MWTRELAWVLGVVGLLACSGAQRGEGAQQSRPEPADEVAPREAEPIPPEPERTEVPPAEPLRTEVRPLEGERLRAIAAERARDRERMMKVDIEPNVEDPSVRAAMRAVPREEFVPEELRPHAYRDGPLPIGYEVTISQPALVARMTELLQVEPGDRVLEVGTGSGYQAAVLDALGVEVYSIEIIEPLARQAAERLARLGYTRVTVRYGDGYAGWPDKAPFAAIIVTAAPPSIPAPLKEQLAVGGRLVVPVGTDRQDLVVVTRTKKGFEEETVIPVRFVPMTGEAQRHR